VATTAAWSDPGAGDKEVADEDVVDEFHAAAS
jgi:hypothetical protein